MQLFDFISDDRFRACLESDYQELKEVMEAGCWKAAHVIAGSIVEAILIDYLLASDYQKRTNTDPLTMDLSAVIDECLNEKALSEKIAGLAHVIRGYRNLIHPGRQVRLREAVDGNGATIAQALVNMVAKEVSAKRQNDVGYTAHQIVSKIEKDPSAVSILEHLLKASSQLELKRLLLKVLPARFRAVCSQPPDPFDEYDVTEVTDALQAGFRSAFQFVAEDIKRAVMKRYVAILKEESGHFVREYEDAFVRAPDLAFVDADDLALVKHHLLSRLSQEPEENVLEIVDGMAVFMTQEDVDDFVDPLVRLAVRVTSGPLTRAAGEVLRQSYSVAHPEQTSWITQRLDAWISLFDHRGLETEAETTRGIRAAFEVLEDPFADE